MTPSFDPRDTFRGRVLRCLHWMVGAVAVLTAVAVVGILWPIFPHTCSPGVDRIDGECIGVTDDHSFYPGGDAHKDPLNKVRGAIKAENEWVARQHRPTVTIAFLGPLTDGPDKIAFPGQDLSDGWAISSHDAMMTAMTAVRDSRHWPPDRNDMLSALRHMQSKSGVNGAVDVVHLDRDGNPVGKESHVMQIER